MTETIIVVLIVLWSIWVTLRRFFSAFVAQQQQRLANIAARKGWTNVSKVLTPAISGDGCDSGCSSCSSRCSTPNPAPAEQVVRWQHQ
jgi:hypothetical protein